MNSPQKFIGIGLLAFAGLVLLFGIPTALIPTPWFVRMIPARTSDYVFLLLNSALIGSYVGLHTYEKHERSKKGDVLATTGSIANIFAVGCPVCNKLLVALLGVSAVMSFFEPLRAWLGVFSAGMILFALWFKIKKVKSCIACRKEEVTA